MPLILRLIRFFFIRPNYSERFLYMLTGRGNGTATFEISQNGEQIIQNNQRNQRTFFPSAHGRGEVFCLKITLTAVFYFFLMISVCQDKSHSNVTVPFRIEAKVEHLF